jgi:MFS family permease
VGLGLSVFQQFVGINVIFYYSSVLWQAVGFSENDSLVITVITSVVNIATTLIAIASVDRFGRRPLLLIGSVGMAVTLGTLAVVFGTAPLNAEGAPVLSDVTGPIALIAANLFVVAFGMSWGPVVWVLLGEAFPEPDPRRSAGLRRGRSVGGELADHGELPVALGHLPQPGVRPVHRLRGALPPLRAALGAGDQGRGAGGHARQHQCRRREARRSG